MARIRTIKPELLEDERTALLPHAEWRLFISLLLLADDYGNFRAAPERVRGAALWGHPAEDAARLLAGLEKVSLIRLYEVDGQRYGHVSGWDKHQKVDHPGKPLCPPEPERLSSNPRESLAKESETLAPDRDRDQDPDRDLERTSRARDPGGSSTGTGLQENIPPRGTLHPVAAATPTFQRVADAYPNKLGNQTAAAEFQHLAAYHRGGEVGLADEIMAKLPALLASPPYCDGPRFCVKLETFLVNRRWLDTPNPVAQAPPSKTPPLSFKERDRIAREDRDLEARADLVFGESR